jgi:hypothetical protein
MKKLSILTSMIFSLLFLTQNLNATSVFDGVKSTVIVCATDPNGVYRCVTTHYPDGSSCTIVDNEGAPGGIAYFGCDNKQ